MRMLGLLAAAGIFLSVAAPAGAVLIDTESVDVDNFAPQLIQGFDSSLGTLTHVELTIAFDSQTGLLRPVTGEPNPPPATVIVNGIARLETLGGLDLVLATMNGTRVYGPDVPIVDGFANGFGSDVLNSAAELAFFTGIAPKFIRTSGNLFASANVLVVPTGFERIRARGTLLYYYDEAQAAPVPEPATWAMMIAGFGVAGFALRRRKAGYAPGHKSRTA